jgi:hypothetical protein
MALSLKRQSRPALILLISSTQMGGCLGPLAS